MGSRNGGWRLYAGATHQNEGRSVVMDGLIEK